jgi:predicted oxidoreductase
MPGADMTSLTIISVLLGVWLGLTFRVLSSFLRRYGATLAGSGAASEVGPVARDICVIAAMQAGYIGGSALFVAGGGLIIIRDTRRRSRRPRCNLSRRGGAGWTGRS